MTRARTTLIAALAALLLTSAAAPAQDRGGNFLDNLFNRGEPSQQPRGGDAGPPPGAMAQSDPGAASVRIDRLENALRQLTGTIEQLQYQNQQLQMQLKRLQEDSEYRFQQLGAKGGAPAAPSAGPSGPPPAAAAPGRRGDVFDPTQQPNAPGAPRALGQTASAGPIAVPETPVGAPGGRDAGAPLDLATLSGNAAAQSQQQPPATAPRNVAAPNTQIATLPPSAKPQDEYDLAYGYVLRKDYALAEQAFKDYLRKFPDERSAPEAQYWLGESLFQQQRYRDAAESFLTVSTKHERSGKAPDALLRLGQSLAAMQKKEAACATLAEGERKYPKASAGVKRSVAAEQRRVHC